MEILTKFKDNIGHYDPKETKGILKIEYHNLTNILTPFEPKGNKEKVYYEIILNTNDINYINSLYDRLEQMKKYNCSFLLSIIIFIISKIIKKAIYKILEDLEI